jgi:hypothetical protein
MGSKLVSKGMGSVVQGAKNVGTAIKMNPGKTLGSAATMGLAGMEASNVASKVKSHMNLPAAGTTMKAPSFYQKG